MMLKMSFPNRVRSFDCCFCFLVGLLLVVISSHRCQDYGDAENYSAKSRTDRGFFLQKIFEKYGHDGVITLEGFEHLMDSLGMGGIHFDKTHDLSAHRIRGGNGTFVERHGHSPVPVVGSSATEDDRGDVRNRSTSQETRRSQVLSDNGNVQLDVVRNHSKEGLSESLIKDNEDEGTLVISNSDPCPSPAKILRLSSIDPWREKISPDNFAYLCPVIIYELDQRRCGGVGGSVDGPRHGHRPHLHATNKPSTIQVPNNNYNVWLYSMLSVLVISLTGMVCVAIVPIIQRFFYQQLLHFFVALAVGSLTGDALLHLLPHAMSSSHGSHNDEGGDGDGGDNHNNNIWLGLTALLGMYFFFVAERLLTEVSSWRERRTLNETSVEVFHDDNDALSRMIGEKLSKQKHNSYGYCYGEVPLDVLQDLNEDGYNEKGGKQQVEKEYYISRSDCDSSVVRSPSDFVYNDTNGQNGKLTTLSQTDVVKSMESDHEKHHEHDRHGHGHTHDFAVPPTVSATAWMVIAGDGLHNFSDGMAIGAAFAGSLTGGLSTAIAVFCHELPHELGDFALLLKAGMGVRQALLYNGLSSVLCFFGMVVGVGIGNISSANSWVFAGVAGMFLYIALVDMVPELNVETSGDFRGCTKFVIHAVGIVTGITIMCLIAVYEDVLRSLFVV